MIRRRARDDRQQLLVTGVSGADRPIDVTDGVSYRVSDPKVARVSATGLLSPVGDGDAVAVIRRGAASIRVSVCVSGSGRDDSADFVHDVEPILSRAGCNQGGCHGKATGQNGFRLSLFGFDPQFDYRALVREGHGRRVAVTAPENSLLLLKATAALPHGGGRRFSRDSAAYALVRRWIAQGRPYELPGRPALTRLTVTPGERLMGRQARQRIVVTAHYEDDTTRDVTRDALFRSNEEGIASVDEHGVVTTGKEPGEAAVMAGYMGQVAVFRAILPLGAPPPGPGSFAPHNYIDELVLRKLRKVGVPPSSLCTDAEFIRRLSLDLCGRLPKPEETRAFLAECAAERNGRGGLTTETRRHGEEGKESPWIAGARLIDRLLEDPDYASFFALKWAGILRNTGQFREGAYAFHAWLREAIAANMPYDRFVREIVAAQGEWEEHPPVGWFFQFRDGGITELSEDVAQLFLGQRLQCAKCHHHPYEKWGQDDYYGLAGFFTRMGRKILQRQPAYYYVARRVVDGLKNPRTGRPVEPKLLDGPVVQIEPGEDPRQKLVDWMADPENPYFATTIANRLWAHFMGRGLVEPLDDIRVTNPATNPELLEAMSRDLVRHQFDLKHLIRTIAGSRTYQLSSLPNRYNAPDRQNFARHYPRRLPAEVLLDAVGQLTGVKTKFTGVSAQARAVDLPHETFPSVFLDVFGRPKQLSSACECARDNGVNLSQVLHLTNSGELDAKIASPDGRAALLAKSDRPLPEKIEELYLWAFCRPPDADELKKALDYVRSEPVEKTAFEELIWTFINCREFQFNR